MTQHTGTLEVWVTTSRAQLPVEGASVAVTRPEQDGQKQLIALLITDESGRAGPLTLPAAVEGGDGLTPGGPRPDALYTLRVEHPNYELVEVEQFQIFPGITSIQQIDLIPLANPSWDRGEVSEEITAEIQPL